MEVYALSMNSMLGTHNTCNSTLRYGFAFDCECLISISMRLLKCMPFIGSLTLHPLVFYLLIFEQRSMLSEIRMSYFLFYLTLVIDEWVFCFALRIYPLVPYAALYCEGPLCAANQQWLMALLCFSFIIGNSPLDFLIVRLHQIFVPPSSRWKLSRRALLGIGIFHSILMATNIIAFGVYGESCEDSEFLIEKPEFDWLRDRGGKIFMFGPPTAPEHFGKALAVLAFTLCFIGPLTSFFTGDAMRRVWKTKALTISVGAQAMSRRMFEVLLIQLSLGGVNFVGPLIVMFSFMVVDVSWIPGSFLAFYARFVNTFVFTTRIYVFGIYFILKNPRYRNFLSRKTKHILGRGNEENTIEVTTKTNWT